VSRERRPAPRARHPHPTYHSVTIQASKATYRYIT